jgi:hypothetical protein
MQPLGMIPSGAKRMKQAVRMACFVVRVPAFLARGRDYGDQISVG